ncbi:MAG: CHAP domain-containing protein [Candidatus Dormibacteraeota bacterium]|nr:CHAP domain-containing protein [Candidatus Dormibacteraeota bacterium]
MKRTFRALAVVVFGALTFGVAAQPVWAADPPQNQNSNDLNTQLTQYTQKLHTLSDQLDHLQGRVDSLNRQIGEDQVKQVALAKEMQAVARVEYERPALSLTNILQARNLDQLLSSLAQARLVANKRETLFTQARDLHARDQAARQQASQQLSQITKARNEAAQMVSQTQQMMANAQGAEQQQAQALNQYAEAAAATSPMPGSGATVPNRFVAGQCTWYVANLRNIPWMGNAIDWWPNAREAGFAEGQTPQVGAIMVTSESGYGHVALVTAVNGSSWTVTEMNYNGPFVTDSRTVSPGQTPVVGFIYGKAS